MQFIADFHIHSKYSRATSRDMNVDNIAHWAKLKGINLMGTGDFTYHLWIEELKSKLEDTANGLFQYNGVNFILTSEISCIYSKNKRTYRVHILIFAPDFKTVEKINSTLANYGNIASDGRPILGMDVQDIARIIFDINENCFLVPAHIWTPWFSMFGSMSGFDRIEDCFGEFTDRIHCIETGLSSDPAMNWRLSRLDNISFISNSDSHSPAKIGREANIFDCDMNYREIMDVLKKKDKNRFLYTIEFFPQEGKYHYDGHRNCKINFSPQQSREHKNICPVCKKPLTIGVMNRVEQLADREEGFVPKIAIPYKSLIPLQEIIAEAKSVKSMTKLVMQEYMGLVSRFKSEFNILLNTSKKDLMNATSPRIAEGVMRVREGRVSITPGHDGEYGIIKIFQEGEKEKNDEQLNLF
ncbi:MAG: endonuclease Q family protein [Candidatus Gygaella obscura]|nr:endonuclease Q family protein [Candidatus Gygaella obscura]